MAWKFAWKMKPLAFFFVGETISMNFSKTMALFHPQKNTPNVIPLEIHP
jgi:hypothetical protein